MALHRAAGMPQDEARRAASIDFGGFEQIAQECHDMSTARYFHEFVQDVRFGFRGLRRSPVFTLVAVATLALGIGMNTAIFTLFDAAVLSPLPVAQPSQVMAVSQILRNSHGNDVARDVRDDAAFVSLSEYQLYAGQNHVFSGLAAYEPMVSAEWMTATPRPISGTLVSCNYFTVLGVAIAIGRGLSAADCSHPAPVLVISHEFWQRQLGGGAVLGRQLTLNHTQFEVVGVAPEKFGGTLAVASQFWAPIEEQSAADAGHDWIPDDNLSWLGMLGRLRPGVTARQAAADMATIAARLNSRQAGRLTSVRIEPATRASMASMRTPLNVIAGVMLAATGMILLLACANLAALLLARGLARQREVAMRLALGATRARIVRQLLAENFLLAAIGGAIGGWVAAVTAMPLLRLVVRHVGADDLNLSLPAAADSRVWLFVLGLSLLTVGLVGLAPALRVAGAKLNLAVKESLDQPPSGGRLRGILVGTQVAGCMVLLLVTGLLLRVFIRAREVNPGFATRQVSAVTLDLPAAGYDQVRAALLQRRIGERLRTLAGVSGAAQTSIIPLGGSRSVTGVSARAGDRRLQLDYSFVSGDYFSLLGVALRRGRSFTPAEVAADAKVVIVNQAAARRLWPGVPAVGAILYRGKTAWTVIGVTADAQLSSLGVSDAPYVFWPASAAQMRDVQWLVRWSGNAQTAALLGTLHQLDPNLAATVSPLESNLEGWRAPTRVAAVLSAALGGLALLLATLGIFGMVTARVAARRHELGVRMALGADRAGLMRMLLRQTMVPVLTGAATGAAIGIIAATAGAVSLANILYGVSPWDGIVDTTVPLLLLAVALAAGFSAARQALGADPVVALRHE